MVGGVQRAERLMWIWNESYPMPKAGPFWDNMIPKETVFRRRARREGYTDEQVQAFMEL